MDLRIKNALGAVGVVAIVIVALAAWSGVASFARATPPGATFSVTGQGKSVGVPDVAQFTFSVVTEGGKDVAALQRDNTTKANTVVAFLKSSGVEAKDIETQGYDIQPRYQSFSCRPPVTPDGVVQPCPPASIVGYTVTQTVEVKVRDFSKTGDLLGGVTERGANTVSGLSFTTDDPTKLQNEARAKAIQNAKQQAEEMAKAGGFKLGRLISVVEGSGYLPYKSYDAERSLAVTNQVGAAMPPSPSIEPGSQQSDMQVTLVYEIL